MNDKITVGIADMKMAKGSGILITYALGSCIGLCFQDPALHLGALLHVMLPMNMEAGRKNAFKYADTGIRETVRQMTSQGALKSRITVKIAGGAKMFEVKGGGLGNIGQRNIESVHTILRQEAFACWRRMWAARWPVRCFLMWPAVRGVSSPMAGRISFSERD
jgi:chemotaxis protein CheD